MRLPPLMPEKVEAGCNIHDNLTTHQAEQKDLQRILAVSESLPESSNAAPKAEEKVEADETEDAEDTVTTLSVIEPRQDENDEERLEREEQAAMSKQRRKQKKQRKRKRNKDGTNDNNNQIRVKPDEEDIFFDKQLVDILVTNLQLFNEETTATGEVRARELHGFSKLREQVFMQTLNDDFIQDKVHTFITDRYRKLISKAEAF